MTKYWLHQLDTGLHHVIEPYISVWVYLSMFLGWFPSFWAAISFNSFHHSMMDLLELDHIYGDDVLMYCIVGNTFISVYWFALD